MVTINRRLNLVVPILRDDETTLYVHSTPIMTEAFEKYHMVLAKTFSTLMKSGLDPRFGPTVAALVMRDVAADTMRGPGLNWLDGPDGVGGEAGLIAEIVRLSNVIISTPEKGWGTVPLKNALDQKLIDEEEKSEVLNLLAFFTVISLVPPRTERANLVRLMANTYDLQTTLSNSTAFATSLTMPTPDENIGEKNQA